MKPASQLPDEALDNHLAILGKTALVAHMNDWHRAHAAGNGIVGWLIREGVPVKESGRVARGQLLIVGAGYERRHELFAEAGKT
jgi:hypothetical protein